MRLWTLTHFSSWFWRVLLLVPLNVAVLAATSTQAHAQATQQVIVTLRDAANHGIDQVYVTLRARDGAVLADGVTDRNGMAILLLTEAATRAQLHLAGITATGTPLQFAATERAGIVVHLLTPETMLLLRVEDDGTVRPDPATMAEGGGVPLATPPAPSATLLAPSPIAMPVLPMVFPFSLPTTPMPSLTQPTVAPAALVDADDQPVVSAAEPGSLVLLGMLVLCIIVGAGLWLVLMLWTGGRP